MEHCSLTLMTLKADISVPSLPSLSEVFPNVNGMLEMV